VIYLSAWKELTRKLNKEKNLTYKKIHQHFNSQVKDYTLEIYCDLLNHCGYIEFDYVMLDQYTYFMRVVKLIKPIPETLTIKQAIQIKKHPWMQWFLEVK
jgi:hypothetical protein